MEWERMDKPLRDLIEIIHFTENVSAKVHGLLDEAEIYRTVKEEFAKSKRYTASILLLTDDGSKLRIAETSIPPGKLKAAEKAVGVRLKGYKIDLDKSSIYSQVVREGKTVQVNVSDIIAELFPRPLAHLISKTMGYEKTPSILTPLKRHGKIIATLAISSTELAEHFIPSVRNLARHISNALALADEYAQRKQVEEELRKYRDHLEELAEERTAHLALLNEIGGKITAVLDLDSVLDRAAHLVQESFGYHHVALFTIDHERGELVMRTRAGQFVNLFPPEHRIKLDQGMIGWVGRHGETLLANDVDAEPRYINFFANVIPTRSELSVPIRVGEEIVGVLDVQSPQLNAFDENDVMVMETLADQIAVAIENARLYEALQQELAERKRAEEALQESEGNLKQAQQIAHLGSWALDLKTNEFTVSEEMTRIYKYEDEYTGSVSMEEFAQYIYPGDRERVVSALNNAIVGKAPYDLEFRIVRTDGEVRVLHAQGDVMRDESGKPVRIVGTGLDITERKRAEEALRESEETARALLNAPTESAILLDTKGTILALNETAAQRLGKSTDELVGLCLYDLFSPTVAKLRKARIDEAIRSGKHVRFEDERRGRTFDNSFYPVFDVRGKVKRVAVFAQDITERKRAERLLQTLNKAALAMQKVLKPEDIFAVVAEELKKLGFSCIVFPTDESQSRLFTKYLSYEAQVLKAAEKLVGLQHEDFSISIETVDLYGKVVRERKAVFVEDAEDIVRQVLSEPVDKFAGQIMNILRIPKSIPAPLVVEDEVIGVFSVQSDDLTEDDVPAITAFAHQMAAAWRRAQLMQDLQSTLDELKRTQAQLVQAQKMEAIGTLAGGIAHDFNNLLTSIGGFTELLLREAPEGSQQYGDLLHIKVATERAAALTRQLLLFTRQEKGERRPTQLNSVVEETRDLLERSIPKEITIELHLEPELWAVEADPSQVSQVLMNLCVNARDAMPDGGTLTLETRNVTLGAEGAQAILPAQSGHYVRLSVSDTGCGMSPEVQARLFEPFFTTKEVGRGTGLGLAVVYGIVRGHEGFITIYSEEGEGSTFRVYLPAIALAVEESEVKVSELPTGTEVILLVDDEETVRKLGQRILERCGYTVLMAEDGFQALEVYKAHRGEIALVVLDVVMPQMGGRECLRQLRQLDPEVRVLISTGYTANSSAQGMVSEGALGVVEKPFLLQDFAIAVRMALDKP
jgi:PAS domain S-box-containing protein